MKSLEDSNEDGKDIENSIESEKDHEASKDSKPLVETPRVTKENLEVSESTNEAEKIFEDFTFSDGERATEAMNRLANNMQEVLDKLASFIGGIDQSNIDGAIEQPINETSEQSYDVPVEQKRGGDADGQIYRDSVDFNCQTKKSPVSSANPMEPKKTRKRGRKSKKYGSACTEEENDTIPEDIRVSMVQEALKAFKETEGVQRVQRQHGENKVDRLDTAMPLSNSSKNFNDFMMGTKAQIIKAKPTMTLEEEHHYSASMLSLSNKREEAEGLPQGDGTQLSEDVILEVTAGTLTELLEQGNSRQGNSRQGDSRQADSADEGLIMEDGSDSEPEEEASTLVGEDVPVGDGILGKHNCATCQKSFARKKDLNMHKAEVHKSKEHWRCDECNTDYFCKSSYSSHMNKHKQGHIYTCDKCFMSFESQVWLERHQLRKCNELFYECTECNMYCSSLSNLEEHKRLMHGNRTEEFECKLCQVSFVSQKKMDEHKQHVHLRPFKCLKCFRAYRFKSALISHQRMVHFERQTPLNLKCAVCDKMFHRKDSFKKHQLTHLEKNLQCPLCDRKFNFQSNLNKHVKDHSAPTLHKCNVCREKFIDKGKLKKHSLMHEEEFPFQCHICFFR